MPLERPAAPPNRPIDLYLEDFEVGQRFVTGSWLVTEEEILHFARQYDPQPFHRDPELARTTVFGGLIASGWHTAGIWMRLYCEEVLLRAASLGSPGIEEVRWLDPVRPGDLVRAEVDVIAVRPSSSRRERGTVIIRGELRDQVGVVKMRLTAWGLFARRPEAGSAGGGRGPSRGEL